MLDAHADRERLWPRSRRRARAASRTCRARCGRPRARHGRPRCARRRRAPRHGSAGLPFAPSMSRSSTRHPKRYSPPSASIVRAHAFDHRHQAERADMRLGDVEDFLRRAGLDELGQHLAAEVMRVLDLAVELAVGERAGAAFAELHVRFRIEHRLAPQAPGVLGALAHHLAALEDDRTEAHLRQHQGGEQSARPGADHHRPRGVGPARARRSDRSMSGATARLRSPLQAPQQRRFVPHLDVERIDQQRSPTSCAHPRRGETPCSRSSSPGSMPSRAGSRPRSRLRRDRAAISFRSGAAWANLARTAGQ